MAKILVKLAQAATRALASSKLGNRMTAIVEENGGSLLVKSESSQLYDIPSLQWLAQQANNAAEQVGVQWTGQADTVRDALNELKGDITTIAGSQSLNPRGPWVAGTDYARNDLVEYGGDAYVCYTALEDSQTPPDADGSHFYLFLEGGVGADSVVLIETEAEALAFLASAGVQAGMIIGDVTVNIPVVSMVPDQLDLAGTKVIYGGRLKFNILNPSVTARWRWSLAAGTSLTFRNAGVQTNFSYLEVYSASPSGCSVFIENLMYQTLTLNSLSNAGSANVVVKYGRFIATSNSAATPWSGPDASFVHDDGGIFDPTKNKLLRVDPASLKRSNLISNHFELISFLYESDPNQFDSAEKAVEGFVEPGCSTCLLGYKDGTNAYVYMKNQGSSKRIIGDTLRFQIETGGDGTVRPLKISGTELEFKCAVAVQGNSGVGVPPTIIIADNSVRRFDRVIGASSVTNSIQRHTLPLSFTILDGGTVVYSAILNGEGPSGSDVSPNGNIVQPALTSGLALRMSKDGGQAVQTRFVCETAFEFIQALAAPLEKKLIVVSKNGMTVFSADVGLGEGVSWSAAVYGNTTILGSVFIGSYPGQTMTYAKAVGAPYAGMDFTMDPTGLSLTTQLTLDGVQIKCRRLSPAGVVALSLVNSGQLIYQSLFAGGSAPVGATQQWWYDAPGGGGSADLKNAIFVNDRATLEAALQLSTPASKLIIATDSITLQLNVANIVGNNDIIATYGLAMAPNISLTSPSVSTIRVFGELRPENGFSTTNISIFSEKLTPGGLGGVSVSATNGVVKYEANDAPTKAITGATQEYWNNTAAPFLPPATFRVVDSDASFRAAMLDPLVESCFVSKSFTSSGTITQGGQHKHFLGENVNFSGPIVLNYTASGLGTLSFHSVVNFGGSNTFTLENGANLNSFLLQISKVYGTNTTTFVGDTTVGEESLLNVEWETNYPGTNPTLVAGTQAAITKKFWDDASGDYRVAADGADASPSTLVDKICDAADQPFPVAVVGGVRKVKVTGSNWETKTLDGEATVFHQKVNHKTTFIGADGDYDTEDSGKLVVAPNPTGLDDITVSGSQSAEADGVYVFGGYDTVGGVQYPYWYNAAKGTYITHSSVSTAPWYCIYTSRVPVYFNAWYTNYADEQQPVGTFTGNNTRAFFFPTAVQEGVSSGRSIRGFGLSVFDSIQALYKMLVKQIIPEGVTDAEEAALPWIEGAKHYNAESHTWVTDGLEDGSSNKDGQELWCIAINGDTFAHTDGMVVYMSGWQGDKPIVKKATNTALEQVDAVLGMCTNHMVVAGGLGQYTRQGEVNSINTTGLANHLPVYLATGTPNWTTTKPASNSSNYIRAIGMIAKGNSANGSIAFCPKASYRISDMDDYTEAVMEAVGTETKDPTGFDDSEFPLTMQEVVDMDFNVGTSTFTITPKIAVPAYHYWNRGQKVEVSVAKTILCPFATSRFWWIVWDGATGNLKAFNSLPDGVYTIIRDNAFVAELVWDMAGTRLIKASFEAHGSSLSWMEHLRVHTVDNTQYESGGLVTAVNNTKELGIESVTIWDDDLKWVTASITQAATNSISTIWRSGPTSWDGNKSISGVAVGPNGRPLRNYNAGGGNWATSEIDANQWVNVHVFASPDFLDNEIFTVMGQEFYTSISTAREGIETEMLQLATSGLPWPEYKALASLCVDADAFSWHFTPVNLAGAMIIDWRDTAAGRAVTATVTDHGALTGLADDDHTQYLLADGTRNAPNGLSMHGFRPGRQVITAAAYTISKEKDCVVMAGGSVAQTFTLPLALETDITYNSFFIITNLNANGLTIQRSGADGIRHNSASTSTLVVPNYATVMLYGDGVATWRMAQLSDLYNKLAAKTSFVAADMFMLEDSANSNIKKQITGQNLANNVASVMSANTLALSKLVNTAAAGLSVLGKSAAGAGARADILASATTQMGGPLMLRQPGGTNTVKFADDFFVVSTSAEFLAACLTTVTGCDIFVAQQFTLSTSITPIVANKRIRVFGQPIIIGDNAWNWNGTTTLGIIFFYNPVLMTLTADRAIGLSLLNVYFKWLTISGAFTLSFNTSNGSLVYYEKLTSTNPLGGTAVNAKEYWDNTLGQANSIDGTMIALSSEVAGDVMYFNGTDWVRLAKGTAGQVLTMNTGATAPEWKTPSSGGSGGILYQAFRDGAASANNEIGANQAGTSAAPIRIHKAGTISEMSWGMDSGAGSHNFQYQINGGTWTTAAAISGGSQTSGLITGLSVSVAAGDTIKFCFSDWYNGGYAAAYVS